MVEIEEQGHSICVHAIAICTFFMLETIASPPYEEVNNVMEGLLFNPITQHNSIFRSQIIAKECGDGMLLCGIQGRTGRHGSAVAHLEGTLEDVPNSWKTQM